ncbi:hypothetical protein H4R20_004997 [Coemansia guatemalensis]|uniref:Cytochrome c oxidase assembly protein COX20, mitochondrial n=1 Tax=Coemansia guatemalensis TaxID=2761395 RepID=A0A9W8HSL1_9FUNG|nr:hypothetical protein H4R20_004997 [Coemansia guatemalensis]
MFAIPPRGGSFRAGSASALAICDCVVPLSGSASARTAANTPAAIVHHQPVRPMPTDDRPDARGDPQKAPTTLTDIAKAHSFGDLRNVVRNEPCAREGLLYGLGSAAAAAMLGLFKRGSLLSAGNWGVATFAVIAVAAKQLCHFQRAHEHAMARTLLDKHDGSGSPNVDGFRPAAPPTNQPPPKRD